MVMCVSIMIKIILLKTIYPFLNRLKISQSQNIRACLSLKTLPLHPLASHFSLQRPSHFGDSSLDFWHALKENDVVVVDGWETAYYTNFSGSSGHGPQPMVVSYGTSPAAEVVFAETPTG